MNMLRLLRQGLCELTAAVRGTPLFLWVYLSVLWFVSQKLTYHYGLTKRRVTIGKRSIWVTKEEENLSGDVLDVEDIRTTFEDIGALEDVKKTLIEHVKWPFTRPELFEGRTLRSHPTGILLYGPPGTGKTLLARALAKEISCAFLNVKAESIFSKWVGDTEKNAAAIFTLAAKLSPCVIFIDEIDAILRPRASTDSDAHHNAKTIFMTNWDGIVQGKSKIVVIGATNRRLSIDEAIRRRLPLQLEVPPPGADERKKILDILLQHDVENTGERTKLVEYVSERTSGYTGSDLTELCKAAALMPLRDTREGGVIPSLEKQHFDEALKRVRASLG